MTTTSTTLSVVGVDDGGESNLTYSWSVSPPTNGDAWFSLNDSNAAKNTTVTFCAAGIYVFYVTATDALGESVTSSTLYVAVCQTLSSILVTPGDAAVLQGQTEQFSATGIDQFGDDMTLTGVTWSLGSGSVGGISSGGLYTAPPTVNSDSSFTVSAAAGGKTGMADLAVKHFSATDPNQESCQEFCIGTGGTFTVPSGATTLYLGIHDGGCWADESGSLAVELSWDTGDVSNCNASAGCVFYALAPSGAQGPSPWHDAVDSCRPTAVSVPPGATSVTIAASGEWNWGNGDQYHCGPTRTSETSCQTSRAT